MLDQGLGSWIAARARIAPGGVALFHGERSITYAALDARVRRLSRGLRGLGVSRGERVAYLGPDRPAFVETFFATLQAGGVFVMLHAGYTDAQIAHVLRDSGCRVLVTALGGEARLGAVGGVASGVRLVSVEGLAGTSSYEDLFAEEGEPEPAAADDLCLLSYTSGTTGASKGVMLSHANLVWNVVNLLSRADYAHDDVVLSLAPLFRMGGLGLGLLPAVFKGAALAIPESSGAGAALETIERRRVSVIFGGPDHYAALQRHPRFGTTDLRSLRFCFCGGAPVPERLMRAWLDRGVTFLQGYGLTEAAPMALLLDPEDAFRKLGSAGRPSLFCEVRVVRSDGSDVTMGEIGEIVIRGPNVTQGYWKAPAATEAAFRPGGWLATGDAARVDAEGYVHVVGRAKDVLRIEGQAVFPSEIERVIVRRPDVLTAAVVAAPSGGLVAFVVPAPDAAPGVPDLEAWLRARLPPPRVPRELRRVDALPTNQNGKVLRRRLRELLEVESSAEGRVGPPGFEPGTDRL